MPLTHHRDIQFVIGALGAGLIIGGATAALKAGAKGAGMIAERRSVGGKAAAGALKKDVARLKKGQLGMTTAQKRSAMGEAIKGIQASTRGDRARLQRETAATGFSRSGAQAQQLLDITGQEAGATGETAARIEKGSQEQAHREKASILARADAAGQKAGKDVKELMGGVAEGAEAGLKVGMQESYLAKLEGADTSSAAGKAKKEAAIMDVYASRAGAV
jgi:hypothetical protein